MPLVRAAEQEQRFGEARWRARSTARRRSTSSPSTRSGSLQATVERRLCNRQTGVRSSWEAFAANLCCSAMCDSSRDKRWRSSRRRPQAARNSSLVPGSRIRWESDPFAAMRVASVMRVSGASMRPASSQPPTRPKTSRNPITADALGAKTVQETGPDAKDATNGGCQWRQGVDARVGARNDRRNSHTAPSSRTPASDEEGGIC